MRALRVRRRVVRALDLADRRPGSVLDRAAGCVVLDGLPGWQTQLVDRGSADRHVLRADFAFEQSRLIVEVDGSRWHPDPVPGPAGRQPPRGLRLLRYTWVQVAHAPAAVLAQVRAADAAALTAALTTAVTAAARTPS